ncbi:unnamed protein product [Rangifer tarandus platyrhynchus]|uniref:Uncharacterized protein n=1 Tax=Rangifer tarandus platyrhynchus TaxID=3082113 RepID=A0ABN8ZLA9_RANTA|nr:unnamed protein product [Rangifer tarandus platyrhynchus]
MVSFQWGPFSRLADDHLLLRPHMMERESHFLEGLVLPGTVLEAVTLKVPGQMRCTDRAMLVKAFLHIDSEWMNDLDRRMRGTGIRIIHFSTEESPSFLHWEVSVGMVTSLIRTPVTGLGPGITHDSSEIDCIYKNCPLKQGHVCSVFR